MLVCSEVEEQKLKNIVFHFKNRNVVFHLVNIKSDSRTSVEVGVVS